MTSTSSPALRLVETGLTTAAGAALGGAVGLLGGVPLAIAAGVSAGLNGAFGGYRQVYDWRTRQGVVRLRRRLHLGPGRDHPGQRAQPGQPRRAQAPATGADFSRRQNRHVFEKGACLKRGFAVTHGNVISNASTGRESLAEERRPFIDRHEGLHIWQNRIFGPIYQAVYVVWFAGGAVVGAATWALKRREAEDEAAWSRRPPTTTTRSSSGPTSATTTGRTTAPSPPSSGAGPGG